MLKRLLKDLIARHRRLWAIRKLNNIAVFIHKAFENWNYDSNTNGEHDVLSCVRENLEVVTVFDVGANIGEWTNQAVKVFPAANIHCFEIVPDTFELLRKNCASLPNVHLNRTGLSDQLGEMTIFCSDTDHQLSTAVQGVTEEFHGHKTHKVTGLITTGDLYCSEKGINAIDFLKIDVEGLEDRVLSGFRGMLKADRIRVLQFEYGYVNLETKYLLKDFYSFLEACNMKIGKIYPGYVDFRDYKYIHEDFLGPNYLAVHASLDDLICALSNKLEHSNISKRLLT